MTKMSSIDEARLVASWKQLRRQQLSNRKRTESGIDHPLLKFIRNREARYLQR